MFRHQITSVIVGGALMLAIWIAPGPTAAQTDTDLRLPAGSVAGQAIGRVITKADGSAELLAYYPSIAHIGASLFAGEPGEATAFFTLRSSPISLATTIANPPLEHRLATPQAGDAIQFNVYYDANPDQDFALPDTFSNGQLIASFALPQALVTLTPATTTYIGTLTLETAADFVYEGQTYNLQQLVDAITIYLSAGTPMVDAASQAIYLAFGATVIAADSHAAATP